MTARGELRARMRPHRRALALATGLGLLGSAAGLAQPLAAREVLEALEAGNGLAGPVAVLGGLVLAAAAVSLVHFWVLERTAQRVVLDARRGLCEPVERDRRGRGEPQARAPARAHAGRYPLQNPKSTNDRAISDRCSHEMAPSLRDGARRRTG